MTTPNKFLISIFIISFVSVILINQYVFPYYTNDHDEGVYIFQAKMLAEGKIYLEPNSYSPFFNSWFIINDSNKIYPKYTPLHALFLAISYVLFGNMVFAIGIISGLNLIFIYLITKEVFDVKTAKYATIIALVSPLFLIISSTYLSYTSTFLLSLIFIYFFIKAQNKEKENEDRQNKIYYIISGISLSLLFVDRPYDGVLIGIPFLLYMFYQFIIDKRYKISGILTLGISFLPIFIIVLYYNYFLTGSPLVFPFNKYESADMLGFGMKRIEQFSTTYIFTIDKSIDATLTFIYQFLFSWTLGGIFLILYFYNIYNEKRDKNRIDNNNRINNNRIDNNNRISSYEKLFLLMFVSVIIGNFLFWGTYHFLRWENSLYIIGPVYYFNLLLPISIISGKLINNGLLKKNLDFYYSLS